MNGKRQLLILLEANRFSGASVWSESVESLKKVGEWTQASSIYQSAEGDLVAVVKIPTSLSNQALFEAVANSPNVTVLAVESEFLVLPDQNLPNPRLNDDDLVLRCASEAWPDYIHPVFGQTLNELVRLRGTSEQPEFYSRFQSDQGE